MTTAIEPSPSPTLPQSTDRCLYNGRFTITSPTGKHKTLKIRTARRGKLKGRRILSIFTGTENDNPAHYLDVAFVTATGVSVWKRWINCGAQVRIVDVFTSMIGLGEQSKFYKSGFRILIEKRCRMCSRPLTTPESIARGIGPECLKR